CFNYYLLARKEMNSYMAFFGFGMFVIGMVVGRITMAVQYEVMKSISKEKAEKKNHKKDYAQKKPVKLEYDHKEDGSSKREFYDYMKKR
ncbi:MAG: hypothetical protein KKE20_02450, partial [Nanoarchaeota archaeon]|nr:hypothetical protein [Nanoarchaeota archaeon]